MIGSGHEQIISVVQDWLNHPRENGKTLELWDTTGGMIEIFYQIKKQFNGRVALISGNNNKGVNPKAAIIPIDSTSEILISSVGDEKIKLESIPTGTVQPTIYADLTHPDVMWLYSSRIKEHFGESFIETIFFIFMFIFGLGTIFLVFYEL
ncbi:hypothetical protein CAEBREN_21975 [Caenorhabditis brenneri]|uniref:Uncharacterized protein n=1 Tax=Caenorhabditis brenneri TaxID=135651 RepID=G0MDN5_CAEBE|nr:hypothetical protein CAEBREN_21975 [Caenorhabditis brenneri]